MKKALIAATTAALLSGSVFAYAANPAPAGGPPAGGPEKQERWKPSAEDRAALTDARIAALKTGLTLSPDQEKLWPAVETALRDVSKDASARRQKMAEQRRAGPPQQPDAIARLRVQADMMTQRAADLTKIADAAQPLYQTLNDSQKHRLQILLREEFRPMGGPQGGPHGKGGPGPHRG
ncbi:Spy/CpxP family protein refolding chaperone [Aquabacter cavernae]|uniref:Spy/CpxP family protein refolding chaperone n=1 Tax=Aquabacter cavernae TaxID=2496029 RepID=UPI000F8EBCDC|nr:Spy/CpxP family protein refolding chaperone [Aquabacter cavernae]